MHHLLRSISNLSHVPIPPFDMDGEQTEWYWFKNNGCLTTSNDTIIVNAENANGAIVYHIYSGDLSANSHARLSETFNRHPHLVVVSESMASQCGMKDNNWLQYALTSVKVNGILQKGYR